MNKFSHPIIIIGMHRSGTSLITKTLRDLGLFIGLNYSNIHSSSNFSITGTRFDNNKSVINVDVDIDLDINIHFVEVPMSIYIKPFQFKHISPYVE